MVDSTKSTASGHSIVVEGNARDVINIHIEGEKRPPPPSPDSHFLVPFEQNLNFVGREEDLKWLHQALIGAAGGKGPVGLTGVDGIGKTQLAVKYAYRYRDVYPGGVFWTHLPANAGDPLPVLSGWAELCGRPEVSAMPSPEACALSMRRVLTGLGKECGQLLVVLDDVREDWLDAVKVLQTACPPNVPLLLTTCDEELALELGATVRRLDVLPPERALELLAVLAEPVVERETGAASRLARHVGYLPLALELAGQQAIWHVNESGWRLADLYAQLEERDATEMLEIKDHGLDACFSLSYESLDTEEQRLFQASGTFTPVPFAAEGVAAIVRQNKQDKQGRLQRYLSALWEWLCKTPKRSLAPGVDAKEVTQTQLDKLVALSLLIRSRVPRNHYIMHSLLRDYAAKLSKEDDEGPVAHTAYYLDYAETHGKPPATDYDALKAEHQSLMKALDQLWKRANIQVHTKHSADDIGKPLPFDAFVKIRRSAEKRAARQYIEMRKHLRDYLRCEGWWLDFQDSATKAYAAACALGRVPEAVWQACEAALAYSLEGWYKQDLETAEKWVTRMEETIKRGNLTKQQQQSALALRMRGVIAMRRSEYEDSRRYFREALYLLESLDQKKTSISKDVEDFHNLLAKLEMRYNPNDERRYEEAVKHLRAAIDSAEQRRHKVPSDSEEKQSALESEAIARTNKAELMIWWGKWGTAAQELQRVSSLSGELGRKDLLAEHPYLEAFVYQDESERESNSDTKRMLLNKAIQSARESLRILRAMPTPDKFLDFCSTYLLLAGLYRSRMGIVDDAKAGENFEYYLSEARELLEIGGYGADANYEAACVEVMSKPFDEAKKIKAYELLLDALKIHLGWCNRAESDFRLKPLTESERWWEFIEDVKKAARLIGRRSDSFG